MIKFIDYTDLSADIASELRENKITKVILMDLMISNKDFIKKIEEFADVLLIDHHPVSIDFNSNKTVYLNAQRYCAAYIAYYLFSKVYQLEYLDWLIVCASLSDFMYKKNKRWMAEVYRKYNQELIINKGVPDKESEMFKLMDKISLAITYFKPRTERVFSSLGRNYGEIGDLERYSQAVRHEIDVMTNRFEKEKIVFKDGLFYEFECIFPIRSYIVSKISLNYPNKTLIIGEKNGESYRFSIRRQDQKVDSNKLARKLIDGFEKSSAGGHVPSAAGNFPVRYLDEFKKRLKNI
jgi:single-stranded DNA-specific DHH superfamily exonuclease